MLPYQITLKLQTMKILQSITIQVLTLISQPTLEKICFQKYKDKLWLEEKLSSLPIQLEVS